MSRRITAGDVVDAVVEHGLSGAWLHPKKRNRQLSIAIEMSESIPGGYKEILRVVREGTDTWPFNEGPWMLDDLWRHWEKAQACANQRHDLEPSARDLRDRLE